MIFVRAGQRGMIFHQNLLNRLITQPHGHLHVPDRDYRKFPRRAERAKALELEILKPASDVRPFSSPSHR
ncbi:unnamed protein product, partial [Nesidiocoris tenuis]